jgi:hypothetical protein
MRHSSDRGIQHLSGHTVNEAFLRVFLVWSPERLREIPKIGTLIALWETISPGDQRGAFGTLKDVRRTPFCHTSDGVYEDQEVPNSLGGHPKPAIEGHLKTGHRS